MAAATVIAIVVTVVVTKPSQDTPIAEVEAATETGVPEVSSSDLYLMADMQWEAGSVPGVQHDLTPDEMAAYLLEHPDVSWDLLTELQ